MLCRETIAEVLNSLPLPSFLLSLNYPWSITFNLPIKLSLILNETLKSCCLSEAKSCIILFLRIFAALKYSCIVTNYRDKNLPFDRVEVPRGPAWWWPRLDEFSKITRAKCLPTWVLADRTALKLRGASVGPGSSRSPLWIGSGQVMVAGHRGQKLVTK